MLNKIKTAVADWRKPKYATPGQDPEWSKKSTLQQKLYQLQLFKHWLYCRDCGATLDWPRPPNFDDTTISVKSLEHLIVSSQNSILGWPDVPLSILAHPSMPKEPRTSSARELVEARHRVWRLEVMLFWLNCRDNENGHKDFPDPPIQIKSDNDTVEALEKLAKQYTFQILRYKDLPIRISSSEHLLR